MKTKIKNQAELVIVPYNVNFRNLPLVKDEKTCLIMSYLEMLFQVNPNGFEKYIVNCPEQVKLFGFSFVDELKIKTRTFREAFRNIGVSYSSVSRYDEAPDKFQGKYYCCIKYPFENNRTEYRRNHYLIEQELNALLSK